MYTGVITGFNPECPATAVIFAKIPRLGSVRLEPQSCLETWGRKKIFEEYVPTQTDLYEGRRVKIHALVRTHPGYRAVSWEFD